MAKVSLKDIADVTAGNVAPKASEFTETGKPFVRAGSLSGLVGGGDINQLEKLDDKAAKRLKMRLFPTGTVLFAKSGMSCLKGYVYTLPMDCYVVSHLACVMPKQGYSEYLQHYLRYNKPNQLIENLSFPSIKLSKISQIEIDLPDHETAKAVVGNLAFVESQIELTKTVIAKLDELVKSRFIEMFGDLSLNEQGWPVMNFDSFATIDTRMTNDFDAIANWPHIGIDSIEAETGVVSGYRTVAEDGVRSGKYPFTEKHIIYSKIRPNLNKVALPNFKGVCSADAYPILPTEGICNREFLAFVMRSKLFLEYILPLSGRAQMPKVNKRAVQGFKMPLPPFTLQREFAAFVQQVDKLEFEARQSIERLQTLYDSLAQEYFSV